MDKAITIIALCLFSCVAADPYIFSAPYYSPAYTAAYTASASIPAAPSLRSVPALSALSSLASLPALPSLPTVPVTWDLISPLSAYSYESEYNVEEVPVVNAAAPLIYNNPYASPLPLAYAADYFYRQ